MGMSLDATQLELVLSEDDPAAVPNGFKRTDAGVIPLDWDVSTVGREFSLQLGKMLDAAKNVGVRKPYLGNRAVQWGQVDLNALGTVAMTPSDLQRYRLRCGDLLVCEGGEIGRAAIWREPIAECYYQKALHRLRPTRGYNVYLMMSFLQLWTTTGYLTNYVTQTSIAHLPKDKFELVPLPLPSDFEQRAIAAALSDVDDLIAALDKLIAKKRAVKQGAMQQLLTGKTRLPGFGAASGDKRSAAGVLPADWDALPLGDLFVFKNGLNKAKKYFGFGTPIVNYMDVFEKPGLYASDLLGRVSLNQQELKNFETRKGDVFFTRTSETVDEIGIASVMLDQPCDTVFSGFVLRARPKDGRLDNLYKKYCFSTTAVRKQIVSKSSYTTRALTNGRLLSAVILAIPPLEEQRAIATVISDMDAEIEALKRRREKTAAIKQGMMQALLTGRVRLVQPGVTT